MRRRRRTSARTSSSATTSTRCCSACPCPDVSGKAIANLEIESLKHVAPTFHGDTIYGETTVLDKTPSKSKNDRGIVYVETKGYKQDGTLVCVFRRKVMVPTETYIKERGGEQPGRPELQPTEAGEVAMSATRPDRRSDRRPAGDPLHRPGLRRQGDHPGRDRAGAPRRVPAADRRRPQGTRPVRPDDPRGVRRSGRVAAHVRAVRRGDRPRLDVASRASSTRTSSWRTCSSSTARRSRRTTSCRGWRRRGARRVLDVGAGAGLRRVGDHVQGASRTATSTS